MKQIEKAIKHMGGSKLYDWELELIRKLWPSVKKQLREGVYAQVNTVSRSGMSRTISLFIKHKGEIINLNSTPFWKLYGDSRNDDHQVRISGCGMDMLFAASYNLFQYCFNQSRTPYQIYLGRYKAL